MRLLNDEERSEPIAISPMIRPRIARRSDSVQGGGRKARNARGAARLTAANPTAKRFRSTSVLFTDGSVPISSRISYDLRLK